MPKFRFAVRSKQGKLRTGTITEATQEAAKQRLLEAGFVIVTLQEEAELVIHQAAPTARGAVPKVERVAIIEFEVTAGERVRQALGRWARRPELAALLLLVGLGWVGYSWLQSPAAPVPVEPIYQNWTVELEVLSESGSAPPQDGDYLALLPDIPLQKRQPVRDGHSVRLEFEALRKPERAVVTLFDAEGRAVAEGEATLSSRGEQRLAASVPLAANTAKR